MFSRYAATDVLLEAPTDALLDVAPAPPAPPAPRKATEGLRPDLAAIDGRWVSAAIAKEGFLCEPPTAPPTVALMLIADDGFLLVVVEAFIAAADRRALERSPEDGRPCKK